MFYFLKLGGSLITDKNKPSTLRRKVLARLSEEIARAREQNPDLKLLIGHGSGSFGHIPANKYQTRLGVHTISDWRGFAEVWLEARRLNEYVISSLSSAGLPIVAFPPSANVFTNHSKIQNWELHPLKNALASGLIPVINGDVIFDDFLGGTILSTEELFTYLTPILKPDRILLVGIEDGVWEDFPSRKKRIPTITPMSFPIIEHHLGHSNAVDVTGGMVNKVKDMLRLVQGNAELEIMLFSGAKPGRVLEALSGNTVGTVICRSE
jgi:isopentenyl phosphate kinase